MAKETTTAVATRQENMPMPINGFDEVKALGEMFEKSGMFGCTHQGQGTVLVLTCKMANLTPLDYIRTFHLIEGKPSMRADAMLAKFAERGGKYKINEFSAKRAAAVFTKGENILDLELTMEQALAAEWPKDSKGGIKKNWRCTPDAMLWARLVSKAVRILDPGVNSGTYTPEEMADFDEDDNRVSRAKRVSPEVVAAMTTKPADANPAPVTVEATVVEPEVLPPATTTTTATSEFVMPFGKFKGKGFSELATNTLQALADTKTPSPDAVTAAKEMIADAKASKEDKTRAEMTVNMSRITDYMKALCLNIIAERAKVQG